MAMRIYVSSEEAAFFNNNKMGYADSIPTSGSYKVGDFIISSTQLDGIFGWVCTEEGTPGKWEVIGSGATSGGGKLVSINASKVVDTAVNQISLSELGLAVDSKDKLIVHFNSMFLMEGVDYEISVDGNSISKLGEGYWNESNIAGCLFTFEVLKNVENVDSNEIKLDSKLICEKNNVTVVSAVSEVNIGISGFNKSKDTLIVYKNATYLIEGVDYEVDVNSSKIVSLNGVWNESAESDYIFTFVVFKEVATITPEAVVDTTNIVNGSVTMDKLSNDVKQAIENASNIDLSGYAKKTDVGNLPSLQTNAKDSLVDAVNELFQSANNGKQIIADAIGSPLSSDDTFAAMGNSINTLTTNFRNALALKGVNAPGDKFETLINRIDEIVQSGNVLNNQVMVSGEYTVTTATQDLTVEINLNFDPEYFIVYIPRIESASTDYRLQWNKNICLTTDDPSVSAVYNMYTGSDWNYSSSNWTLTYNQDSFNVTGSVTQIPANTVVKWHAIGSTQLPNNGGERIITPSTSDQVLPDGYYSGDITVKGDVDLKPENIVEGVEIFGVTGTFSATTRTANGTGAIAYTSGSGTFRYYSGTVTLDFTPRVFVVNFESGIIQSGITSQASNFAYWSQGTATLSVSITDNNVTVGFSSQSEPTNMSFYWYAVE